MKQMKTHVLNLKKPKIQVPIGYLTLIYLSFSLGKENMYKKYDTLPSQDTISDYLCPRPTHMCPTPCVLYCV